MCARERESENDHAVVKKNRKVTVVLEFSSKIFPHCIMRFDFFFTERQSSERQRPERQDS